MKPPERYKPRTPTGIRTRHGRSCPAPEARCTCKPSYEAFVYSVRDGKKIRKTFPTLSAARSWRHDASTGVRKGTMRAPTRTTLREAWESWYAAALDGRIRSRCGDPYKPSALRGYEASMRLRVLDDLGAVRLADLQRRDVQDFADRMVAVGHDASTIRNTITPLQVVYRRALSRGEVSVDPTAGLQLPAVRGTRDRVASPAEAAALIAALRDEHDRCVWAVAFYAGLRLGEIQALRPDDVDLAVGVIKVRRSWDGKAGEIEPKSRAGRRDVPIVAVLRGHLAAHLLRRDQPGAFLFGLNGRPLDRWALMRRSRGSWAAAAVGAFLTGRPLAPEFGQIGLHEARHTYASILIAARVNLKALSAYLGHSSVTITLDRYGHLMPGNEAEAVGLVDAYLSRSEVAARI